MPSTTDSQPSRFERILAFMLAGLMFASVAAILAVLIAQASGVSSAAFGTGIWPVIAFLPYVGLPLAIIALIVLTVVGLVRRAAQNRDTARGGD
ncbi:hypothetical protein [Mycetocola reblochoni]|uniref:Multidrug ABC transporter ATPase n=2 Tax=Mycetocola reblochoni TaxID=331618 RepID=A0A1R4IR50_9MICO|nr:hypothetical protein [Mycetocola reblochoni]RLP68409.1 multidrug ABC transporter ATPase [Mycetocola reblochoni]SJN22045.1 hypothetical protein FM119_03020 [Mycetocola reblochoni REB411]